MSSIAIFAVGIVVFAITVYGTVMAGGLLFTRRENNENLDRRGGVDDAMLMPLAPKEES